MTCELQGQTQASEGPGRWGLVGVLEGEAWKEGAWGADLLQCWASCEGLPAPSPHVGLASPLDTRHRLGPFAVGAVACTLARANSPVGTQRKLKIKINVSKGWGPASCPLSSVALRTLASRTPCLKPRCAFFVPHDLGARQAQGFLWRQPMAAAICPAPQGLWLHCTSSGAECHTPTYHLPEGLPQA